jgi:glutamine---fructose-6-phosphate transaminase (isomerizing)
MTSTMGSLLRREIFAQPDVLARILEHEVRAASALAARLRRRAPRFVLIVGRGSADNAGMYGKYLFGALNRLVVAMATPSLVTQYGRPPDLRDALVLAVSQSGESYDVVEMVAEARRQGALTVAITNAGRSPLAAAAEEVLLCHAGPERSLAATKTYSAQVLLLALLSASLAGDRRRLEQLAAIPARVAEALAVEPAAARVAERMRYLQRCAVVSRGFCYGSAFEVALKLQELTYVVAQPYSSADFRHGPIAVVEPGFCVVALAPSGRVLRDLRQLLDELRGRQAEIIAVSDAPGVLRRATCALSLPRGVPEWLAPLTCIVPAQLLAMHISHAKGHSLDEPRGLSKVTRTR